MKYPWWLYVEPIIAIIITLIIGIKLNKKWNQEEKDLKT